ncbi:hypothetical protein Q3G72_025008 [Acer saccharum]|nr:hypothetical protein Q3G72_025008 [Acer saccharum]
MLNDAKVRQISDIAVKMWLEDLKDVAFDADDVLDEFATKALILRLRDEAKVNTNQVWSLVPSLNPNMASFKLTVTSKIHFIMYKLEEIAKERVDLGLQEGLGRRMIQIKERR